MEIRWKQYVELFATYLRAQSGRLILFSALLLIGAGLQLVNPQLIAHFIDAVKKGSPFAILANLAWLYLLASVLSQLSTAVMTYLGADIGWIATNRLRADLALHCVKLDIAFHHRYTPGEMIERIDGDVNTLSNFFSVFLVNVIYNILMLIGVISVLFVVNWGVGLALAVFTLIAGGVLVLTRNYVVPFLKAEREVNAAMMGFVEERLGGLEDIRANSIGAFTMQSFSRLSRSFYQTVVRAWMMRNVTWLITSGFFLVGTIISVIMGTLLYQHNAITLGTVYLIFQYNTMLRGPLEALTRQLQELQQANAGILRIRELMNEHPTITDGDAAMPDDHALSVEFSAVTFAYHAGDPVLRDIAFTLAPGRVLGVLGRTGSGKTTLLRLLYRLYDIQEGTIQVGGSDIRAVPLRALRTRIGLVTQDVQLFHATVRENLTFFNPTVSDERIRQMIEELGLLEWFAALPHGLDTMLHAGGSGLSAGESQLLAFTRVFLGNAGLVLLDEPSSRLDPATERLISRAVDRLLHDRTCIIIAHRLGTVQRADDILIFDEGRIIEYGERALLERTSTSRFAHLLRTGQVKELL